MKKLAESLYYVGVSDHELDLFEGQYEVPNGMAYNSYIIVDEKVAIMDSVDISCFDEWLKNIKDVLGDRKLDYLVIHHMEPDHSSSVAKLVEAYPDITLVSSFLAFKMLDQFFHQEFKHKLLVNEGSKLSLGKHELTFVGAPMVHWPEVIVSYEPNLKTLFSADGFGKFGAFDYEEDWACEARRYYFGIVGKFGVQVQALLKKAAALDIQRICPLHGPVLDSNLSYYLNLYDIWSKYEPEAEGVAIFYTSVYGHTKAAVEELEEKLKKAGAKKVVKFDLARDDESEAVEDAFKYGKIVFATTTYSMSIFPVMNSFLTHLIEHNYQNRDVAIIENGSWAPNVEKVIKEKFKESKDIRFIEPTVKILSSMNEENHKQIDQVVDALLGKTQVKEEKKKQKWVCKICGYVHEADELPEGFTCPICKHPASDFQKVE